ncbi:MAG: dTDP-4-dehydrorhamnose reductase, partial [Candidatus Omnitrophica bacterium]|nr:dTDP-4-dehydrorhamnose reductase [Candidatus Omnitrophota bacterium]
IQCDITDRDRTVEAITNAKPDLIIHAAAWTDVDGCERDPAKARKINVNGTENVALSASDLGIPLVYISTDFVFDGDKKSPYTEKDRPKPICIYGKSKLEGEERVRSLNKYIILRTSWLYGAKGKNFVDTILEKARGGEELKVVNDQVGSPTYTKDFAKAMGSLLHVTMGKICGTYHISNKGEVSWFGYAKEILKIAGIDNMEVVPIKSSELDRPARRPAFSVLDNAKFEAAFTFNMRQWQESLQEYLHEKR